MLMMDAIQSVLTQMTWPDHSSLKIRIMRLLDAAQEMLLNVRPFPIAGTHQTKRRMMMQYLNASLRD